LTFEAQKFAHVFQLSAFASRQERETWGKQTPMQLFENFKN